jgi:multiple antibiotic resistance protein
MFEFALLSFSSLFVIVDPIGLIPVFIAITPHDSPKTRSRMAGLACVVAALILLILVVSGPWIFKLLGVTLPAMQIAGSIILLLIAVDMIQVRRPAVQATSAEIEAGSEKEDIAITPLAVPMLAGPGAISNVLILLNRAQGISHVIVLAICIVLVFVASYIIFRLANRGVQYISPLVMKVLTRLMGLLLAAIAMQFLINALQELGLVHQTSF